MTQPDSESPISHRSTSRQTLMGGVAFLIGVTFIQRFFGISRQALFCGFLTDDELGRWSIALTFLTIAAPLVVFGIPGSFGRYVQHYRTKNQLRAFVHKAVIGAAVPAVLLTALVLLFPQFFAQLLFGESQQALFVLGVAVALVVLIVFNGLVELLMAMRLPQAASVVHFVNSVSFTLLALIVLWGTPLREGGVVLVCIISMVLAGIVGWIPLRRAWQELVPDDAPLPHSTLWRRILPYTVWVWAGNLVANLFELGDQLLIKHFSGVDSVAADSLVGQYYTAKMIPNTFISLAGMISVSLVPYLVIDWERGRRDLVSDRLNSWLKLISFSFTVSGAFVMCIAPPIFSWALPGKYDVGLALLPWTAMYCVWASMSAMSKKCLVCAERGGLATASMCIGLSMTIGLNLVLLPHLGLRGVVLAASIANLTDLLLTFILNRRLGAKIDFGVVVATFLPLALSAGSSVALAMAGVIAVASLLRSSGILSNSERTQLQGLVGGLRRKVLSDASQNANLA